MDEKTKQTLVIYGQVKASRAALPGTGNLHYLPPDLVARIESADEYLRQIARDLADKAGL